MQQFPSQKGVDTPVEVVSDLQKKYNYTKVVTDAENDLIVYLTYDYARKLGYFQDTPIPEMKKVIMEWLLPQRWEFMHCKNVKMLVISVLMSLKRRVVILKNLYTG